MDSDYVDYLSTLDERRQGDDMSWIDERIESRFFWEREDAMFRNVQVLG
jgi:hypothetical protein